jgi:hypothetical protein
MCGEIECGWDCLGQYCGECWEGSQCLDGYCTPWCEPNCWNKQCGPDGCGGSCGTCPVGYTCNPGGACVPGGTGKSCLEITECAVNQCLANGGVDIACVQSCLQGAKPGAQQQFLSLAQCVSQVCGYLMTQDCFWKAAKEACVQQYMACVGG